MTEQIDKLNKEIARLNASNSRLHGRVVAQATRIVELELIVDQYASKQTDLISEIDRMSSWIDNVKSNADDWKDTNWGA